MVGIVDRVGFADESDARTCVLSSPRLWVASKPVALLELNGGAWIELGLF